MNAPAVVRTSIRGNTRPMRALRRPSSSSHSKSEPDHSATMTTPPKQEAVNHDAYKIATVVLAAVSRFCHKLTFIDPAPYTDPGLKNAATFGSLGLPSHRSGGSGGSTAEGYHER